MADGMKVLRRGFSTALRSPVVILLLAGSSAALLAQQDYEVRLNRPVRPGNQFKIVARGRKSHEVRISPAHEPPKETKDDFTVEYIATRKILAVDEIGRATKISDVIERFSLVRDGRRTALAQPGAKLVAFVEGIKKNFEIDGQRVDEQTENALKVVIDITTGAASDDEVFGTNTRRKVGDSWAMNAPLAAQDMAKRANVEVQDISGEVSLASVTHESAGDALKFLCHFKGNARPSSPDMISSHGAFEATWSTVAPVDLSLPRTEDSVTMNFQFQAQVPGRDGGATSLAVTVRESLSAKTTPLSD